MRITGHMLRLVNNLGVAIARQKALLAIGIPKIPVEG